MVQAAELIRQRYGVRKGVHIHLEKRIPVAAGLAGGSSDAAAALSGLNRLWRLGLSADDLRSLAAELGSDVPFCIAGGTAVARGRGELLTPIDNPLSAWVVLARPPIHVSTAAVYGRLKSTASAGTPTCPPCCRQWPGAITGAVRIARQCAGRRDDPDAPGNRPAEGNHAAARSGCGAHVRQRSDGVRPDRAADEGRPHLQRFPWIL